MMGKDGTNDISIEKSNEVLETHMDCLNNGHGDSNNRSKKMASFATIFKENTTKKIVEISELRNDEFVQGVDVAIPLEAIEEISHRIANTIYGTLLLTSRNNEASTSQSKEAKESSKPHTAHIGKTSSDLQEITFSLKNYFEALKEKIIIFGVNTKVGTNNNVYDNSKLDDSNSEGVKNVFMKDNGKPMDGLVNDARKKVEAPPKKIHRKTGICWGKKTYSPVSRKWSMRMLITNRVDDFCMVIGIYSELIYFCFISCVTFSLRTSPTSIGFSSWALQ
uniref:Uncharacterized protein n=1 Tax=Tanacetum cinerariifolium TaxID=118510 RepID=A0A699IAL8_TANCI|nr:hypothetical protein [Tanacetum cinerariifolium]